MSGYHRSTYEVGRFRDGAWYCSHGDPAAQNWAGSGSTRPGMRFWACDLGMHGKGGCRFFLWEDHIEDAITYHKIPEEVAIHVRQTPSKRKRDRDIRDYYERTPKTPRTPRTRDAGAETPGDDSPTARLGRRSVGGPSNGGPSNGGLSYGEPSNGGPSNGGPSNRTRDLSPSPLPRTASRPQPDLIMLPPVLPLPPLAQAQPQEPRTVSMAQPGLVMLSSGPAPQSRAQPHAPRTPLSKGKERATIPETSGPIPFALAPSPGRRRLSSPELKAYNSAIKALATDNVRLSRKGQNALRDIIKEESYWME